ncbi:MAG TPA: response regulator [Roseiflexaceae bacterium]|nr:response regulator [Roseiflexaceae bacterium]
MTSPLKRILMVEDEPDIQAVAQLALEALGGFQVRICGSGREGVQAAPAFAPDLILLDVMMPGMDGPSTLRALREQPRVAATPVIFMTAKVQPQEVAEYRALGVLDVIAKPFDPMTLAETIRAIWARHRPAGAVLAAMSENFAATLGDKLSAIDAVWEQLRRSWEAEALARLHRQVHSLHGAGATLGLGALGDAAGALERALAALDRAVLPDRQQREQIDRLIDALKLTARTTRAPRPTAAPVMPAVASIAVRQRLIWLVQVDPALARDLTAQLGHFGYHVQAYDSLLELGAQAGKGVPGAIITSADVLDSDRGSYEQIAGFGVPSDQAPPLIVISSQGDISSRLRAVRAGAAAYFVRPVTTVALIDKLDALTAQSVEEPYRILIVEDEPIAANYFAETLRQAGMHAVVVNDPNEVMQPLAEFRPDMILMDMYMPGCGGLDLAAVIRQQEEYVGIPIVFLSAEASLDKQLEAMRLGGDDYMTKPITPDHLISAVSSRVLRSRTLRSFMLRDSLTGLFNHTTTKGHLELELARARRHQTPLAFAIIDIDRFKSVNDRYGHATGDRVLKSLSRLLRERLRQTNIIGRYGGEEFAVVLVDTDGPTAIVVLDEIRAGLAQIRQQADGEEFTVTFSCGVACFADYPDAPKLADAADKALYAAKRGGRNRVVLAGPEPLVAS